ncbi:hypothetical protein BEN78_14155 [Xanthomonas citri pv. mangiferaeindicae]|nr:hypothetical protein BEN78_14155 [Xanthomonas citri pv. mangiferaeindicae]
MLAVGLSGCVSIQGPGSREEWQAIHVREYHGKSQKDVLDAAEKILRLADHDFNFDYPDGKLVGQRSWVVYMAIAIVGGTDYWTVSTEALPSATRVTVDVTRATGSVYAAPVIGGPGATVQQSSTPGVPLRTRAAYDLFFARLDHLLSGSGTWTTCDEFKLTVARRDRGGIDTLCSITTDDKAPDAP